ncbi:MAG: 23S rRNA (guanosine(2251)-2'-O)-methyltransferase RlmB [Candidatus Hydrothermia bacterium]
MYVYGKNQVLELLRSSPQKVEKVLIAQKTHLPAELLRLLESLYAPVIHVERDKLTRLAGTENHQGILAFVRDLDFSSPEDIARDVIVNKGLLLILDHVKDPQNLGNIVRSAEAFGASGVVIPAFKASGFTETVVRASAGAIFNVRVAVVKNVLNYVRYLKESGIWVYSLERGGKDLYKATFNFPLALIAGAEDEGVSKSILKESDEIVTISMVGKINSLNVASSVAIALSWIFHLKGA